MCVFGSKTKKNAQDRDSQDDGRKCVYSGNSMAVFETKASRSRQAEGVWEWQRQGRGRKKSASSVKTCLMGQSSLLSCWGIDSRPSATPSLAVHYCTWERGATWGLSATCGHSVLTRRSEKNHFTEKDGHQHSAVLCSSLYNAQGGPKAGLF